ncbi:MAG: SIMPL domain-containing protein [Terricaulis sp.]
MENLTHACLESRRRGRAVCGARRAFDRRRASDAAAGNPTQPGISAPPILGTILSISAEGKVEGAPDLGTISLGVMTEAPTAAAALQENANRMTALTRALRAAGLAERDIQTSNLSVNPQYQYGENVPPRITGYQASNNVTAKVRDLSRLGRVVDAAVAAGGNTVNGVSFGFQNPEVSLDAARTDAIAQATRRAELYARALNLRIHRVISVSEGGGYAAPMPMPVMMMARDSAQASTPVSPGEISTTSSVNVVYELR